jgi:short-subunit dehydrogenase
MSGGFRDRYGEWALVTGASSGIGLAVARELAARGLKVALAARTRSALEALSSEFKQQHGVESLVLPIDLSRPGSGTELATALSGHSVGLVVNAAGFGTGGEFLGHRLEDACEMVDVNCRAVLELTHSFGRRFAEQRRGGLILFSSLVAFQGVPFAANYAATKAYVQSLGEALAEELAPKGVDVLTVAPGPVMSGFGARAGMTMRRSDQPAAVAAEIVRALGKSSRITPGSRGKFLTAALSTAPRFLRVKIMKGVMKSMTDT